MHFLEARLTKSDALAIFQKTGWNNLWGVLDLGGGHKRTPHAELLWFPHYLISIKVNSRKGPGDVLVSVEGHSGVFMIVEMETDFAEGTPEGETFEPRLTEEEAIKVGRRELLKSIMRRRGHRDRPVIEETIGAELFFYPFWVYYSERRRGLLDIKILDAVTGEKGRPKTKVGVLSALIGSDKAARKALDKNLSPGPDANGTTR